MGFTVKRYMKANLPLLLWMLPCSALESVFASEMISYTRESPGNFVMSIFLDFRFSRSGLGPEKFSVVPK